MPLLPTPAQCRARLRIMRRWIGEMQPEREGQKETNRKLLLYGVVPADLDLNAAMAVEPGQAGDDDPLTFLEQTNLDTWFFQHPEKVCGKEVLTSSREFPLTIKGTRQDCERVFEQFFGSPGRAVAKQDWAWAAIAALELEMEMELDD